VNLSVEKSMGTHFKIKGQIPVESIEYYTNSMTIAKELTIRKLLPGESLNNIGLV